MRLRRRTRSLRDWPETIELVVLALLAGSAPAAAIESTAARLRSTGDPAVADAFADVVHRMHRGVGLADALAAVPERLGPATAEFADSIATAERYGLPLGPTLERLGAEARSERRRRAEAEARSLPVRLSFPLVVCTLPSFVLLAIVPAVLGAIATLRDSVP